MKRLLLCSFLVLTACMPAKKEYTVIREQSRPAATEQQTPPACPASANKPICPVMQKQQPAYYAGTYTMQQPTVQFVVPAETYQQAMVTQPVMMTQQVMSEQIVTQPMMPAACPASQNTMVMGQNQIGQSPQVGQPNGQYPMGQQPQMPTQNAPMTQTTVSEDLIILQHPTNRDLVKCPFGDDTCVLSYQSRGYVQLRNAPHFAGYNDVLSESDYPTRRWRDNNDIPRW